MFCGPNMQHVYDNGCSLQITDCKGIHQDLEETNTFGIALTFFLLGRAVLLTELILREMSRVRLLFTVLTGQVFSEVILLRISLP